MIEVQQHIVPLNGCFVLQIWEGKRKLIDKTIRNGITYTAINDMFETQFRNGTQKPAWYIGLIDNVGYTAVNDETDTMASHSGWTELYMEYDESSRPAWGPDAAASQTIANSQKAIYTFNASAAIRGLFVTSDPTKNGVGGTLWSTGILSVVQNVQPGQEAKVFYSLLGQEG